MLAPVIKTNAEALTIKLDVLPHNRALSLVVLVDGNRDLGTVHLPAYGTDKLVKVAALHVQPRFQNALVDLPHRLADGGGYPHAHQLLEARHVGDQVGVQVVRVECRPKGSVVGALEQISQVVQLLHGLGQGRVTGCWVMCCRVEGCEDVAREQGEAEREVRAGEDGEGLDKNVGDGLIAREMRVELVSAECVLAQARNSVADRAVVVCGVQIELIMYFNGRGDSVPIPRVIGNVVVNCSS
jgi:hypothetical protein